MSYEKKYAQWLNNPISFWEEKAKGITWIKPWEKTLLQKDGHSEWFHGGTLNTCYNCVDRHVKNGNGKKYAILYDSPVTNKKKKNFIS